MNTESSDNFRARIAEQLARRRLLTLTRDSMPPSVPAGVIVQPAHEWLLSLPA